MSIGGTGAFGAGTARAQTAADIALVVRAGADGFARCFDADALRQRIAHYSTTGLQRARELRLELYVDAADSAELSVYRGSEQVARRRFVNLPDACADRRDAVALSIALALDAVLHDLPPARDTDAEPSADLAPSTTTPDAAPEVSAEPQRRAQSTTITPEPEVARAKPAEAVERVPAESRTPSKPEPRDSEQDAMPASDATGNDATGVDLHLGGRWLAEAAPSTVWTGALGAELALGRLLALDASAFASTVGSTPFAGARARSRLTGGELLGCAVYRFGNFAAQGCVGADLAACSASGQSYAVHFPSATVLWAASTARLALRWPDARRVSVRVVMQGHVNMVRPELRVDGSSQQLAPSWIGGSLGLDMLVALE